MPEQSRAGVPAASLLIEGHLGADVREVALVLVVLQHAVGARGRTAAVSELVAEARRGLERAALGVDGLGPAGGVEGPVGGHVVGAELQQAGGVAIRQGNASGLTGGEADARLGVDLEALG